MQSTAPPSTRPPGQHAVISLACALQASMQHTGTTCSRSVCRQQAPHTHHMRACIPRAACNYKLHAASRHNTPPPGQHATSSTACALQATCKRRAHHAAHRHAPPARRLPEEPGTPPCRKANVSPTAIICKATLHQANKLRRVNELLKTNESHGQQALATPSRGRLEPTSLSRLTSSPSSTSFPGPTSFLRPPRYTRPTSLTRPTSFTRPTSSTRLTSTSRPTAIQG